MAGPPIQAAASGNPEERIEATVAVPTELPTPWTIATVTGGRPQPE